MIRATAGPDRWRCSFTDGTRTATADTPKRDGAGDGFRPHELLAAALATCLTMTVRMRAAERGVAVDEVEVTVELDREGEATTFVYDLHSPSEAVLAELGVDPSAVECPVHRTLTGPIEVVPSADAQ